MSRESEMGWRESCAEEEKGEAEWLCIRTGAPVKHTRLLSQNRA